MLDRYIFGMMKRRSDDNHGTVMPSTYQVNFVTTYQSSSAILRSDEYNDNSTPHIISSAALETYGDINSPRTVRLGNGGLGPTGLVRALCEAYLVQENLQGKLKIEWVCNHSRHTQIALQAGVIDIAITYEREEEARAEAEGWWSSRGVFCHDHFILAGPSDNPARLPTGVGIADAFARIAQSHSDFHTRGDGSATMHKEHELWSMAGIDRSQRERGKWYSRHPATPFDALLGAETSGAYLLSDRATFLLAKRKGETPNMVCYVEGGSILMNSCALGVRVAEKREEVLELVAWLHSGDAQTIIATYGRDWRTGVAVITPRDQLEAHKRGECRWHNLVR